MAAPAPDSAGDSGAPPSVSAGDRDRENEENEASGYDGANYEVDQQEDSFESYTYSPSEPATQKVNEQVLASSTTWSKAPPSQEEDTRSEKVSDSGRAKGSKGSVSGSGGAKCKGGGKFRTKPETVSITEKTLLTKRCLDNPRWQPDYVRDDRHASGYKLCVQDLDESTTTKEVEGWFKSYNPTDVHVVSRSESGAVMAFVTFKELDAAIGSGKWVGSWTTRSARHNFHFLKERR